jgi:hypothetical protein
MFQFVHRLCSIRWFSACCFLACTLAYSQGDSGFLRGKGALDLALSYSEDTYDSFWVGSDRVTDAPFGEVTRTTINLYAAYGLSQQTDLVVGLSHVGSETDAVFDSESELQDFTMHLKWRAFGEELGQGRLNLLLSPGIKVPVSDYENDAVPAIGDGQTDLRLRGIAQYVWNSGAYIALETGYDIRFEDTPNEIPIHLTAGATFFDHVTVSAFISNISSQGGYDIGEGPFYGVEEEYTRYGSSVYLRVQPRFGISLSGWATSAGKNTGDVTGFSFGLVWRI